MNESRLKSAAPKFLLVLTIMFIYILMVFGNIVTSTGSGLACPDWPLCYGTINPPKQISIWIEWTHRLLGATTGILILTSAFITWKIAGSALRKILEAAVMLIILAIFLGGMVVLVEAPLLDNLARIALISSHIIVATLIFTGMILVFRTITYGVANNDKAYQLSLFGLLYFQVFLGIFVRYSSAYTACPDFPTCQGSLLPPDFLPETLLYYTHRVNALVIFLLTFWHLLRTWNRGRKLFYPLVTFGLITLQAVVGVLLVFTGMFLPVIILHGAVGFILLGWAAYQSAPHIIPNNGEVEFRV
ncbi:MAG: heme A synthase [Nitrospinota bacterium]